MATHEEELGGDIATQESEPERKVPPSYAVVLHNDDYTTMEFVTEVLKKFFRKSEEEAVQIMLQIHEKGRGVAGIYHHEIAETKVVQVHEYARAKGFPLKCSLEAA
jgi:ATP-dependent Clp protease adaptor protein ClpS